MNKIEALRKAADFIEQNLDLYNWGNFETCNLGFLASICSGISISELKDIRWKTCLHHEVISQMWSKNDICSMTGTPITKVFQDLVNTGFTNKEIHELEFLTDELIRESIGIEEVKEEMRRWENAYQLIGFSWQVPQNVIAYFREKANRLEQLQSVKTKSSVKQTLTQSVRGLS